MEFPTEIWNIIKSFAILPAETIKKRQDFVAHLVVLPLATLGHIITKYLSNPNSTLKVRRWRMANNVNKFIKNTTYALADRRFILIRHIINSFDIRNNNIFTSFETIRDLYFTKCIGNSNTYDWIHIFKPNDICLYFGDTFSDDQAELGYFCKVIITDISYDCVYAKPFNYNFINHGVIDRMGLLEYVWTNVKETNVHIKITHLITKTNFVNLKRLLPTDADYISTHHSYEVID